MADLVVVLGVLAFFGLCVLFVMGLDRLVGNDDVVAPRLEDVAIVDAVLDDATTTGAGR